MVICYQQNFVIHQKNFRFRDFKIPDWTTFYVLSFPSSLLVAWFICLLELNSQLFDLTEVKLKISMLWMTVSWCELFWTDVGHTMHKHECAHLSRCTLNVTNNYQSKPVFIYDVCLAHSFYRLWNILPDRFIQKCKS